MAVVRAADLRVRANNHHEVTLAAAGFLAGGKLEGMLQEFQALRLERVQIEYGWKARASPAEVDRTLPRVHEILALASRAIRERKPAVASEIRPPAGPGEEKG